MAKQNKTVSSEISVIDFLNSSTDSEEKRNDSFRLVELMREWSGCEAKMWGGSIVGFGSYHYKYASGHEGDAPLIGFSPRKAEFSLYVYTPDQNQTNLLAELGKYKMGKACIYIKKLADIDTAKLEQICKATIAHLQTQ
ncbi:protein of unknown function (DU1801) [Flexibacter flexilis DSM 6793]|uniref:YdhG-like domain-containing protein n=1 Tax=Flexibacter flexilis DSM 6793 TaxID=927664 RepID=A0A1I1DNI3_9BACT|nr:DUF1801 domain-containing protein [Flexibacter flexilis]SFB74230.1 protein of unknown function (DU1801) [Flexibacter flexilis DSM 6793]